MASLSREVSLSSDAMYSVRSHIVTLSFFLYIMKEWRTKMSKRLLSVLLCLYLTLAVFSAAFAAQEDTETGMEGDEPTQPDVVYYEEEEYGDDPTEIEDLYTGLTTIYDLENEEDVPPVPDETPPPPDTEPGEPDSEIYGNLSFDDQNALQLQGEFVIDEIIVKFKTPEQVPGKEDQLKREIRKVSKISIIDEALNVFVIKADDFMAEPNAFLNRLKNNKYIEYAEPNYILSPELIPNDPNYRSQAITLSLLNALNGWDILSGSSATVIAVIDTGVANHVDLPPLLPGYSSVAGLSPNNDRDGHGTSVAGTIGMIGNNNIGGVGINWNASIIPVKVDTENCVITVSNIAKGVIWAADNGAQVISMSVGAATGSITLKNAIDYAFEKGCLIVAAAGNDGKNGAVFPARYDNVIGVGATTNGSTRATWSNFGEGVDLVAVGGYYSTSSVGGYVNKSGTSFASPQVSALASMVWALNPELTNVEVRSMIEENCKMLGGGFNANTGNGLIDIAQTLDAARKSSQTGTKDEEPPVEPEPEPELPPESPQETWTAPSIKLTGFSETVLEYGQSYVEPGFYAEDCKGEDLTQDVKIINRIDIWTAGIYTVTYDVIDSMGMTAHAIRTVTVNPKPVVVIPPTAPKITVNGSNPIVLHLTSGTPYTEQRARAVDYDGTDISHLVTVTGSINRNAPGTYTLTYGVTSPASGLKSTTTRNVRIIAPTEKKDPRVKYGFSGQAKQGGIVNHTGIVCRELGFIDLQVTSLDNNMTISVRLVDVETKKTMVSDTYTAAGKKQYRIDEGRYDLTVAVTKANGNGKYSIDLLMPETIITTFEIEEVPLNLPEPSVAPIGSNPIILHIGGTPYHEQGARAIDFNNENISDRVVTIGSPDTSKAGTYTVTYKVVNDLGFEAVATREVRILAPNEFGEFEDAEVPFDESPFDTEGSRRTETYIIIKGDTLWFIAQKFYGQGSRWREIYDVNIAVIGSNPNMILIGQILTIYLD